MELIKHTDFIYEYKNIISDEDCNNLFELSNICNWESFNATYNENKRNRSINLTRIRNKYPSVGYFDDLAHICISKAHKKYSSDNIKINWMMEKLAATGDVIKLISEYYYRKYDVNDDYEWHIDFSVINTYVLSYVFYLNDDFEGGDTLFLNQKIKVSPSKGSILCFPCGLDYIHKSTKITSGRKCIIWTCMDMLDVERLKCDS